MDRFRYERPGGEPEALARQGLGKAVLARFVVAGIGLEHRLEAGWRAAGPATLRARILLRAAETFFSKDL